MGATNFFENRVAESGDFRIIYGSSDYGIYHGGQSDGKCG